MYLTLNSTNKVFHYQKLNENVISVVKYPKYSGMYGM